MHVILGTGPLGRAVMKELLQSGERVRMVNTSGAAEVPTGVEIVKTDLMNADSTRHALKGASVVYHCAAPPYHRWRGLFDRMNEHVAMGAAHHHGKLVVADNLYMYGQVDGRLHEDLPYGATTKKGKIRAQLSERLMELHRAGTVQVAIARGSDFFGPYSVNSKAGDMLFGAIIRGKKCVVMGDPDRKHSYTFTEDFGRTLVTLGRHEDAFGQIWHVPSVEAVTTRQFAQKVADAAGMALSMGTMGRLMLTIGGIFLPQARESIEMLYESENDFVLDSRKFETRFGERATPFDNSIPYTLEWFQWNVKKIK